MNGIDDQIMMAYLDGELDPTEHARVGQALVTQARPRERLATLRRLGMRLADRYDPIAREDIPEHLREIVEGRAAALV